MKLITRHILVPVTAILLLTAGCASTRDAESRPAPLQSEADYLNPGLDIALDYIGWGLYFAAPFLQSH